MPLDTPVPLEGPGPRLTLRDPPLAAGGGGAGGGGAGRAGAGRAGAGGAGADGPEGALVTGGGLAGATGPVDADVLARLESDPPPDATDAADAGALADAAPEDDPPEDDAGRAARCRGFGATLNSGTAGIASNAAGRSRPAAVLGASGEGFGVCVSVARPTANASTNAIAAAATARNTGAGRGQARARESHWISEPSSTLGETRFHMGPRNGCPSSRDYSALLSEACSLSARRR